MSFTNTNYINIHIYTYVHTQAKDEEEGNEVIDKDDNLLLYMTCGRNSLHLSIYAFIYKVRSLNSLARADISADLFQGTVRLVRQNVQHDVVEDRVDFGVLSYVLLVGRFQLVLVLFDAHTTFIVKIFFEDTVVHVAVR